MEKEINKNKTVHILFEQSGTFKKALKEQGFNALDYDIENNYNQTDIECDIFQEITKFFIGMYNIFDEIDTEEIVIAFFPCTYFSDQSQMFCKGSAYQLRNKSTIEKLKISKERVRKMAEYHEKLCLLCEIALRKNIKLIVENPLGKIGFLEKYFPIETKLKIKDRSMFGDFWKKPTVFYFVNCNIEFSLMQLYENKEKRGAVEDTKDAMKRSEISELFASWFIKNVLMNLI